jgi:hypothetical protein
MKRELPCLPKSWFSHIQVIPFRRNETKRQELISSVLERKDITKGSILDEFFTYLVFAAYESWQFHRTFPTETRPIPFEIEKATKEFIGKFKIYEIKKVS